MAVGAPKPKDKVEDVMTEAESPQSDTFCYFYHSVPTAAHGDKNELDWVRFVPIEGLQLKNQHQ